jgi:hypothetical protein
MIAQSRPVAVDTVAGVTRDGDLVRVTVRFTTFGQPLPAWLASARSVTAALDDAHGTKLAVRSVQVEGDELHVTVAGAKPSQRFTLRFDGLLRGSDSVTVSQLADAEFDPLPPSAPPEAETTHTLVDYIAKDFKSFKRLMLDSISHKAPGFVEQHEADAAIALIEVLAFAADNLSYYQDAVATEAYLETARRRVSVRRHARPLGYRLSEGCTPRVWLAVEPAAPFTLARDTALVARTDLEPTQAFEPLDDVALHPAVSVMSLWDDGRERFAVKKGATSATLARNRPATPTGPALARGSVLIFEEGPDPATGLAAPVRNRQAVRLNADPLADRDHPSDPTMVLTQVTWWDADALTIDFAARTTIVRGNIVPADYGETMAEMGLPAAAFSDATATLRVPIRDLTFAVPYDRDEPAAAFTDLDPSDAVPSLLEIKATSFDELMEWKAVPDLIAADRADRGFAVDVENSGALLLRFGDGSNGERPDPSSRFTLRYRQGSGVDGHVGANTITELWCKDERVIRVTNPLPSAGGQVPEAVAQAKRWAPDEIRVARGCIVESDYQRVAQSIPGVTAYAVSRWTGDRTTVHVYVHARTDPRTTLERVRTALGSARLIGADFVVRPPRRVPVVARLRIAHVPGTAWLDVKAQVAAAVQQALAQQSLTLGSPLFASWLSAAATGVASVVHAELVTFARLGGQDMARDGCITVGPAELAVLVDERGMATKGLPLFEDATP